jgi:Uri superfamily endonuclease
MAVARGSYALVLALDSGTDIAVGGLGSRYFPPGYYVYVGSALGGLFSRVRRHVRGGGRTHWHIDYLRRHAGVAEVWYLVSDTRWECAWYRAVSTMPRARVPVAGFGSSGCGCPSHLAHFASAPSFEDFRRRLGDRGLGLRRLTPEAEEWDRHFAAGYSSLEKKSAAARPILSS